MPIFAKVFLLFGVLVVYVVEVCLVVVCASILHVFVEHTMHSSFNKGKHFELVSKLRDDSSITIHVQSSILEQNVMFGMFDVFGHIQCWEIFEVW